MRRGFRADWIHREVTLREGLFFPPFGVLGPKYDRPFGLMVVRKSLGSINLHKQMVRFYELQLDHFTRRGLYRRFGSALGYYITNFYLHVWGLMEQLTVMAKYQRRDKERWKPS